jgi:anaerobic magnesium-protoporphyrin IX monomethyl ester cyclase
MKACLVNTPFNLFKHGYGTRFKIKRGQLPPLGIGILASVLEEAGYEVLLIDASALGYGVDKTVDVLKKIKPDIIGISTLTAGAQTAIELAKKLKETLTVPVVLGGAHATCFPEKILKECPSLDAIVIGEGENIIVPIFNSLLSGGDIKGVESVAYLDGGEVCINDKASHVENLDSIPYPAWGLMKQKYRRNSPEYVVEHIEMIWNNYGIREISFWDDNFMINSVWLEKFCKLLKKRVPGLIWSCYGRADTVSPEKFRMIADAGCWSMFIGFESGEQHLLDLIGK